MKISASSDVQDPMSVELYQEVNRYNKLVILLETSLNNVRKALEGLIVMNNDLEDMAYCVHNNIIPQLWKDNSYPSLMPLNEWLKDCSKRVSFFANWLESAAPKVYPSVLYCC